MGAEDLHPGLPRASVEALNRAGLAISDARALVRTWRHGDPEDYAAAGGDAITRINEAEEHLRHARQALFEEIAAVGELLATTEPAPPPLPAPDVTGHPSGAGTPDTGSPGDFLDGSISIATPGAAGPDDGSSR